MSAERLELVTDFATLRAGMIVVSVNCPWCGASKHRHMLVSQSTENVISATGAYFRGPAWSLAPERYCNGMANGHVITRVSVDESRLFRVVDSLDRDADEARMFVCEQAAAEVARTRKTVRT